MTKEEKIAWIVILVSVALGELVLWGVTHGWFVSTFWFANAMVGAVLAALGVVAGITMLRDESR